MRVLTAPAQVAGRFRIVAVLAGLCLTAAACAGPASSASSAGDTESGTPGTDFAPPSAGTQVAVPRLDDVTFLDAPGTYEGPSTALMAPLDPSLSPERPQQDLPATVTSRAPSGDRTVTVDDASRVVAIDLSGSIAATVWGLGLADNLVGIDAAAAFPGSEGIPVVTGSSHTVNPEAILALEPTVVITDGSLGPTDALEQLADAGVTLVYVANEHSFAGAQELATEVGDLLGAPAAGAELALSIGASIEQVRDQIAARLNPDAAPLRIAFVYLRGSAGIYYLFGEESGADELVDALGGIDAAADAGIDGMKPLTDEAMVAANPDVILVMSDGLESVGGVDGLLDAKPAIALTAAGQHRRIVDMDDRQILAFGPRSADILEALALAIYAPEATP